MDSRYWKWNDRMRHEVRDKKRQLAKRPRSPRYVKRHRRSPARPAKRDRSPHYSRRRRRSRTKSRSSSRSGSTSSRSSSDSLSRHSHQRSHSSPNRDRYRSKSPERSGERGTGYAQESRDRRGWLYPSQLHPPSFPQEPPPIQGQFPENYQVQNFRSDCPAGYGNLKPTNFFPRGYPPGAQRPPLAPQPLPHVSQPPPIVTQPPPPLSQLPPHLSQPPLPILSQPPPPILSQPPPHEMGLAACHRQSNWEMFVDTVLSPSTSKQPSIPGEETTATLGNDPKAEELKKEARKKELLHEKGTLAEERDDYIRLKISLIRELDRFRNEEKNLSKEKSRHNDKILHENAKIQEEIQKKLKSVEKEIEILSKMIRDSSCSPEVTKEVKHIEKDSEKHKKRKASEEEVREDMRRKSVEKTREDDTCIYYDPGLHWCADCNVFPKTLSQYLEHLHSQQHKERSKLKATDYPWHAGQDLEEKMIPMSKDGRSKRIPIRGVQFLVPAMASYCSLCKVWLGDSHCANKHLQSVQHTNVYNEFIMKNPHWEVDWLTERTQSYEKNSETKHHWTPPESNIEKRSNPMLCSLSEQLIAMLAANYKPQDHPPAPPPPHITNSSSSSSEDDSPSRKSKKKKKSSKRSKHSKERKPIIQQEPDYSNKKIKHTYDLADGSFISQWIPKVEGQESSQSKKKMPESKEDKDSSIRSRMMMMREYEPDSSIESDLFSVKSGKEIKFHQQREFKRESSK